MSDEQERRRFHRFPFDARCSLKVADKDEFPCDLLDISINGALVKVEQGQHQEKLQSGDLRLNLSGKLNGRTLDLTTMVNTVRLQNDQLACRFTGMDVESFDQLKTLVADNLGDVALLDRELTQLDYWPGLSVTPGS
jgi:hypothetical protein